jgi:Spy/CpxP family protein refolding chaperone
MPTIRNSTLKGILVLAGVAIVTTVIGFATTAQLSARPTWSAAQEQAPPPPDGQRGPGRMGGGMMGPGGPGMRGGPGGPLGMAGLPLRELGLSDAQQQQVRATMESHRDEHRAAGEKMRTARKALQEAVAADTFNDGAIRAAAEAVGAAEGDIAVLQAKVRAEVVAILTPEQVKKAKELRAEMEQRMKEGRGGHLRPHPKPAPEPRAEDETNLPETV